MALYRHILLAVDLGPESILIGRRARELAAALDARLDIINIVEMAPPIASIPPDPLGPGIVMTETELLSDAQKQLVQLARELGIPETRVEAIAGDTKNEIIRAAVSRKTDLIVLGNHQRHALRFFIRPTEDVIVHRAPCDVLAVHLPPA
jgi:universal stress protein A